METSNQFINPQEPPLDQKKGWFASHWVQLSVIALLILAVVVGFVYLKNTNQNPAKSEEPVPGFDMDRDGVRDDVQAYIVANYQDEDARQALLQYARALQGVFTDKYRQDLANEASAGTRCLMSVFSPSETERQTALILSKTMNTPERLKIWDEKMGDNPPNLGPISGDRSGLRVYCTFNSDRVNISSWKTYTSSQYQIEFKYPSDWQIDEEHVNAWIALGNDANEAWVGNGVYITRLTPEQIATGEKNLSSSHETVSSESIVANGVTWKKVVQKTTSSNDYSVTYSTPQGDKVISVNFRKEPIKEKIVDQILSTFIIGGSTSYSYKLADLGGAFGTPEYYDSKLVKISSDGKETVLVPSTKKAILDLAATPNRMLQELSLPKSGSRLYFVEILGDTDAPPRALYVYDLVKGQFSRMAVSQYYAGFGERVLSPDGMKLASTVGPDNDNDQKLFLVDLNADTAKVLVTLSGQETLNSCVSNCFGGFQGNVSWKDSDTVQYSVYDGSKVSGATEKQIHPLIANRTVEAQ